jgi:Tol biopolymer transport system component
MSKHPGGLGALYRGAFVALCLAFASPASAQYFGQNKVQYEKFDFRVLKTEHFDIHYYPEEADAAKEVSRMAERWYARLSKILQHQLSGRQPVILYASHPDFEQTNVIEGFIGEGTGGVTEGAMRRVTLPLAATLAETDHVLGHELVHAFQYDILGAQGGEGLPLWFIEGMAEYLSIGPRDPQTAMWMRDAALNEKLPAIKDLDNPKYFPYRFGHAFWAYVGGRWGDDAIGVILATAALSTSQPGQGDYLGAIETVTERPIKQLSDEWQQATRLDFSKLGGPTDPDAGILQVFGSEKSHGEINVGPSISPDGTKIAFLSSRERLSVNLYLANAQTGKVEKKLLETASDPHFDSLQFLASAGTWDPSGHQLALGAIRNGRPVLAIIDADKGGVKQEIPFKDLGEIFQPTWSPDGKSIAFSSQVGGHTDLFLYDFNTKTTTRLTDDSYGDLQPAWSPDGKQLAFVTDRFTTNLSVLEHHEYGLATIDVATKDIKAVDLGLSGNAINPQWSGDGSALFFISDNGGRQNVWKIDLSSRATKRVTDQATGVAGITPLSPGLSISRDGTRASVSVFRDSGYDVYVIDPAASSAAIVEKPNRPDFAMLPPASRKASAVAAELKEASTGLAAAADAEEVPYSAKLHLVGIGQAIGVSSGGTFGTYVSGGISFVFSDTLGNHMLGTTLFVNGGVRDIGAQVQYLNRTGRWNWGLFGERIPYVTGMAGQTLDQQNGRFVVLDQTLKIRETDSSIGAMTAYPLTKVTRVEFSGAVRHIGFSQELTTDTYDFNSGQQIGHDVTDLGAPDRLRMLQVSAGLVHDTSIFGATSPLRGTRFHLEAAPSFGDLRMVDTQLDYRRYWMPIKPITFAGRALHVARYGPDSEDPRLVPLFLGYPDLVRGYDSGTFLASECGVSLNGSCPTFDQLFGSRMLVFNGEVRAPLVGLFTHSMNYGSIPVEVFGFADSGVAWTSLDKPAFANGTRNFVTSVGAGARVNVFGYLIAEFNMARPIDRPERGWLFVFNLRPGF